MRFIFRPLTSYAVHTRKWCRDIAAGIKGNGLVRRVLDGFLIQVTKRNGTAIADVIDLPGDIYIAAPRGVEFSHHEDYVGIWYSRTSIGYVVFAQANDGLGDNMTYALVSEKHSIYSYLLAVHGVSMGRFLGGASDDPGADIWDRISSHTQAGADPVYSLVREASNRLVGNDYFYLTPQKTAYVFRVKPRQTTIEYGVNITSVAPGDPPTSASEWSSLSVDISATGVDEDHRYACATAVSFYGDDTGYFVYFGLYGSSVGSANLIQGWRDPSPQLGIAKISIINPSGPNDSVRKEVTHFALFTNSDLLPEDYPQLTELKSRFPEWAPRPSSTFVRLEGDVDERFQNKFDLSRSEFDNGTAGFYGESWLSSFWATSCSAPACVAHREGVDVLFAVQSSRDLARFTAVYSYEGIEFSMPAAEPSLPNAYYNHRALYLVRFSNNGKQVRAISRSTFAYHDPAHRDDTIYGYTPVLCSLLVDGEGNEDSLFVCVSSACKPRYYGYLFPKYWAPIPRGEDVSLEVMFGSGGNHSCDLGGMYPVFFPDDSGLVAPAKDYDGNDIDGRHLYGQSIKCSPAVYSGRPSPVCLYAEDMMAVVAAPVSGFLLDSQTAKLAVVRISTGEMVGVSEFDLPFSLSSPLVQWSVTCVEQGAVKDGALVVYAKLLITKSILGSPSIIYRADDLKSLIAIGAVGNPGATYARGPAYYLGSPLAPAKVGRSTGRSFLKGKPVTH